MHPEINADSHTENCAQHAPFHPPKINSSHFIMLPHKNSCYKKEKYELCLKRRKKERWTNVPIKTRKSVLVPEKKLIEKNERNKGSLYLLPPKSKRES